MESHLYYLDAKSFLVKIYKQLKTKVKINVIEEKKTLGGAIKKQYVTRTVSVEELTKIPPEEKEKRGLVIQELIVSKLAMATF